MRSAAIKTWAREIGCGELSLKTKLMEQGHLCEPRQKFTTREVFRAMIEDPSVARARESEARAKLIDARLKKEAGDLVPVTDLRRMLVEFGLLPARDMLLSLHLEVSDLDDRARIRKRVDEALAKLNAAQVSLGLMEVADAT